MLGSKTGCSQARGWFSEYLDGRLKADRARSLEAHLQGCPHCREELDALTQVMHLMRSLPVVAAPRSFALRRDMAPAAPAASAYSRRGWTWAWGLATAAASLALAFFVAGDVAGFLPHESAVSPAPSAMVAPVVSPSPEIVPAPEVPLRAMEAIPGDADAPLPPAVEPDVVIEASPLEKIAVEAAPALPAADEPAVATGGWPLLQIELALTGLTLVLISATAYSFRRRRTGSG